MSIPAPSDAKQRVIVYIDGFNFYFGLRASGFKCYYWMDYPKLANNLVRRLENSELAATKLFTARINTPEDKRRRQNDYLEVLQLRRNIEIIFGNYKENKFTCSDNNCRRPNYVPNEKQTDVNIAVQMVIDAYENRFDTAILIGGDSDLVPPIREIKRIWPHKHIRACFPPARFSNELRNVSDGQLHIKEADLKNSLLPDEVRRPDDYVYRRPKSWS